MNPIPEYFDFINRTALIIKPKKPFFEWLKSIDPKDDVLDDYMDDPDVNLLPDFEEIDQIENWIKKNFDAIFRDQMNQWYTEEDLWVQNRTLKLFNKWFEYSMHTMIWDTLNKPILRS